MNVHRIHRSLDRHTQRRTHRHRLLAMAAVVPVVALALTACAGGSGTAAPTTTSGPPAAVTTSGGPDGPSTPTPPPASTSARPQAPATPGEPMPPLYVRAGSVLSVVGVAHDDVLNVRQGPGPSFPVVTTLGPLADDVVATGRGWRAPAEAGGGWYEVTHSGATGWANGFYLAWQDTTSDITSGVVARMGRVPVAETMADLGLEVARSLTTGPEKSLIVMSVAPSVGDLGEVSYDVVGLSDDVVRAHRLHVFGQPTGSGEGFSLKSVESTDFCSRGAGCP